MFPLPENKAGGSGGAWWGTDGVGTARGLIFPWGCTTPRVESAPAVSHTSFSALAHMHFPLFAFTKVFFLSHDFFYLTGLFYYSQV